MIIVATFKGTSGSLGYEKGKTYPLRLEGMRIESIDRTNGTKRCEYSSIESFLNNWSIVSE